MQITKYYSPNHDKKPRSSKSITTIIIHYTGMQSERESLKRLCDPRFKVSCHFLINRKGKIFKIVDELKIAWHAGKSKWKEKKNLNKNSIGIELVNKGHKYGYQNFPKIQINSLINLCKKLKKRFNIHNQLILGHSDIAPNRKVDPGEKFPWNYLSLKGIGIYPIRKKTKFDIKKTKMISKKNFIKNLRILGYRYLNLRNQKKLIKNFQRKYRPKIVSGNLDHETYEISEFLTKKSK